MKSRKTWIGLLMALTLCVGVFFTPVTAFAATDKDTTPPKLSAVLEGETVKIQASDEGSGLEAVFIDSRRVATLVNGAATVVLKDYHGNNKEVTVYAVDYAGNKSDAVKFLNPLYTAPVTLPPASTPTPPASSSSQAAPPASSSSSPAPASSSQAASSGSSSQSTAPSGSQSTSGSDTDDTSSSNSDSQPTVSAIPDNSDAFTPEGSGEVLDTATEESKSFYSITTPDGYVYYLVIDHARDTDNVYFLNAVTEEDLLGLAGSATSGQSAIPQPIPEPEPNTSEPTSEPEPSGTEGGGFGTIIFLLLAVAVGGGVGWYFKIYKPRQQAAQDGEGDFADEEDEGENWSECEDWDENAPADDYDDYGAEEAYQSGDGTEYDDEEGENS